MSRDDRDRRGELQGPVEEDAPVTPAEQARAEAFGKWLDGLAAGEPLPPAMDSDDRALLETATMVLASSRAIELAPERTRRLVDQALENAVLGEAPSSDGSGLARRTDGGPRLQRIRSWPGPAGDRGSASRQPDVDRDDAGGSVTDLVIGRRRRADRVLRHLPWAVASLAAAAAVILFMSRPAEEMNPPSAAPVVRPLRLGVANTSRPADSLVGVITRRDAGRASERLDVLFADRMSGYRDLTLRRALGQEQP